LLSLGPACPRARQIALAMPVRRTPPPPPRTPHTARARACAAHERHGRHLALTPPLRAASLPTSARPRAISSRPSGSGAWKNRRTFSTRSSTRATSTRQCSSRGRRSCASRARLRYSASSTRPSPAPVSEVSVLLFTVTFYANLAHSLTRSP
jgi:hypothetical protein